MDDDLFLRSRVLYMSITSEKEYLGPIISLGSVSKDDMGAYLCIAQNGVPPAVSRRIILQVKCTKVDS